MNNKENTTIIYGKNAVVSAVTSGKAKALYFTSSRARDPYVTSLVKESGVSAKFLSEKELTALAKTANHQGYVALVGEFETVTLDAIIKNAKSKQWPLLVMLDGIEDPHNLGAIMRSVDAFGGDGIIMKQRGEVPLNATVAKVSTGAIDYVKVAVVNNLTNAINELKDNGFWIVGTDGSAESYYDSIDYKCPICLVVGSEGFGISRLVLKNCDFVVKIPMFGHVNSLNASVATSVFLSEINLNRSAKK